MADHLIHEYRVIETDDGYRIEIKGDKSRSREVHGHCMGQGQGIGLIHSLPGLLHRHMGHGHTEYGHSAEHGRGAEEDQLSVETTVSVTPSVTGIRDTLHKGGFFR